MFEHRQTTMETLLKENDEFRRIYNHHQDLDKRKGPSAGVRKMGQGGHGSGSNRLCPRPGGRPAPQGRVSPNLGLSAPPNKANPPIGCETRGTRAVMTAGQGDRGRLDESPLPGGRGRGTVPSPSKMLTVHVTCHPKNPRPLASRPRFWHNTRLEIADTPTKGNKRWLSVSRHAMVNPPSRCSAASRSSVKKKG